MLMHVREASDSDITHFQRRPLILIKLCIGDQLNELIPKFDFILCPLRERQRQHTSPATVDNFHETLPEGQFDGFVSENQVHFAMLVDFSGQIQSQRTGNALAPKATIQ